MRTCANGLRRLKYVFGSFEMMSKDDLASYKSKSLLIIIAVRIIRPLRHIIRLTSPWTAAEKERSIAKAYFIFILRTFLRKISVWYYPFPPRIDPHFLYTIPPQYFQRTPKHRLEPPIIRGQSTRPLHGPSIGPAPDHLYIYIVQLLCGSSTWLRHDVNNQGS